MATRARATAPVVPDELLASHGHGSDEELPEIRLRVLGDVVLAKIPKADAPTKRYEFLFEHLANTERSQRLFLYRFLVGQMLTGHARRTHGDSQKRRSLFAMKNEIMLGLASQPEHRARLNFKYLTSQRVRVVANCDACSQKRLAEGIPKFKVVFCDQCQIDRTYYNVVSLQHRFHRGNASLFLSQDLIPKLGDVQVKLRGKLEESSEETVIERYHYNSRNLACIALEDVLTLHSRLLNGPGT